MTMVEVMAASLVLGVPAMLDKRFMSDDPSDQRPSAL